MKLINTDERKKNKEKKQKYGCCVGHTISLGDLLDSTIGPADFGN